MIKRVMSPEVAQQKAPKILVPVYSARPNTIKKGASIRAFEEGVIYFTKQEKRTKYIRDLSLLANAGLIRLKKLDPEGWAWMVQRPGSVRKFKYFPGSGKWTMLNRDDVPTDVRGRGLHTLLEKSGLVVLKETGSIKELMEGLGCPNNAVYTSRR